MSAWRRLKGSFEEFVAIQDHIVRNSVASDPDWRHALVALRKQLQDSLVAMRAAVQACEEGGGDAALCRRFAGALSEMRGALALHQAQWPAVAISIDDVAYRRSVRELRDKGATFRDTARGLIVKLEG